MGFDRRVLPDRRDAAALTLAAATLLLAACDRPGYSQQPGTEAARVARPAREGLPERFVNSIGLRMQLVPAGRFEMGSDRQIGSGDRRILMGGPKHPVEVSAFYLGSIEVTKGMYREFVAETGVGADNPELIGYQRSPPDIQDGFNSALYPDFEVFLRGPSDRFPVSQVTWDEARQFCEWLSAKEGRKYRLPTEAEWEYACRAGTTTEYWWGDEWNGNWANAPGNRTFSQLSPCGTFPINPWGFYDVAGNAWEWCSDWWDGEDGLRDPARSYYANSPLVDPTGPARGLMRIRRGGAKAVMSHEACLSYWRAKGRPDQPFGGLRVALEIDDQLSITEEERQAAVVDYAWTATPEQQAAAGKPLVASSLKVADSAVLDFVWCPAGEFRMGTEVPENHPWRWGGGADGYMSAYERPVTTIRFQNGFFIGRTEVTQAQFVAVMGNNPSRFVDPQRPVESVGRDLAADFLMAVNKRLLAGGQITFPTIVRWPTEREWEYACRAGGAGWFCFGDDPSELYKYAWYDHVGGTGPVAAKLPNAWGVYDMHGNVAELVWFPEGRYPGGVVHDPYIVGPPRYATYRGGSWAVMAHACRSAARRYVTDSASVSHFGLRLVIDTSGRYKVQDFMPPSRETPKAVPGRN